MCQREKKTLSVYTLEVLTYVCMCRLFEFVDVQLQEINRSSLLLWIEKG